MELTSKTINDAEFSMAEHRDFLASNASSIDAFRAAQAIAYQAERDAWAAAGEFDRT